MSKGIIKGFPKNTLNSQENAISVENNTSNGNFSSMGEKSSIGTTIQGEDLWEGVATQLPVPPDAGEQMTVVSSSAADAPVLGGVITIRIEYLDENGLQQTEDIAMNGTTPVDTTSLKISFVNDMYALTVGANGVAAGNIIIYRKGDAARIYNMVSIGGNKSLVINRKVPSNKILFITGWGASEANNKKTSYRLRATCNPDGNELVQGFLFKRSLLATGTTIAEEIDPPIKICSGALVKISAWATGGGGTGSGSFNGYLVDA